MNEIHHDLKRDIHNLLSLLNFIKTDEEIKDPEIREMLELTLQNEKGIKQKLNSLGELLKKEVFNV